MAEEAKVKSIDGVYQYLGKQKTAVKGKQIKDALHLTNGQVAGAIYKLRSQGKVVKGKDGGYELANKPKAKD